MLEYIYSIYICFFRAVHSPAPMCSTSTLTSPALNLNSELELNTSNPGATTAMQAYADTENDSLACLLFEGKVNVGRTGQDSRKETIMLLLMR